MGPEAREAGRPQGFKKRSPLWWKMYADLFERWSVLPTDTDRCHIVAIWQLATELGNRIPADPQWIQLHAGLTEPPDLDLLEAAGLIGPIGQLARAPAHHARREERRGEREREGEREDLSARPRVTPAREGEREESGLLPIRTREREARRADAEAARAAALQELDEGSEEERQQREQWAAQLRARRGVSHG